MPSEDFTTERDVALDILAALDMYDGLCGSETTTIEELGETGRASIYLTLSNGDRYELRVRQIADAREGTR